MRTSNRDRIITGALELAHRDGFDTLTFDALAEHVGLTVAASSTISAPRPNSWRELRAPSRSDGGPRHWRHWASRWTRRAAPNASRP